MGTTLRNAGAVLLLAVCHGMTPMMLFLSFRWLNSPSLLGALKSVIGALLFLLSYTWSVIYGGKDAMEEMKRDLGSVSTYWKIGVRGLLHGTAPYFFAAASLGFLPPAMIANAMVASVWIKLILERVLCLKIRTNLTSTVIGGSLLGSLGIALSFFPVLYQTSMACKAKNASVSSNGEQSFYSGRDTSSIGLFNLSYPYSACSPLVNTAFGALCLMLSSTSWAGSQVFWERHKGVINFQLANFGQNIVACIICVLIWIPLKENDIVEKPSWGSVEGVLAVVYLGVVVGWISPFLSRKTKQWAGASAANQYLIAVPMLALITDWLYLSDAITVNRWMVAIELAGICLVSGGIYITNLKKKNDGGRELYNGMSTYFEPNQKLPFDDAMYGTLYRPLLENETTEELTEDVKD